MSASRHHRTKLVIVETHPIQYKAPLFRALAADSRLDVLVLYAMIPDAKQQGAGFGVSFSWDVPLLEGYPYRVLTNVSHEPSVTRFSGCDTPELYDVLKSERPDAVLVNGWVVKTCLQALWACRCLGIPCMVRGEANLMRPRAWWKHTVHRILLKQYQAYLYIGEANRAFYRFHGCTDARMFFVPYCVDNRQFHRDADSRSKIRMRLRAEFGIRQDDMVFLFAGKLEEKKHPDHVIRAAAMLPAELKSRAHLLFAGDGSLRNKLTELVDSSGVCASFAGFVNQSRMPDFYAASDVLVLPSDAGETWGLVVNEAMASGLPAIVSSQVGCAADLILRGSTGACYDYGNIEALSELMIMYVRSDERAHEQGRLAVDHISRYSIPLAVEGIYNAMHVKRSHVCN